MRATPFSGHMYHAPPFCCMRPLPATVCAPSVSRIIAWNSALSAMAIIFSMCVKARSCVWRAARLSAAAAAPWPSTLCATAAGSGTMPIMSLRRANGVPAFAQRARSFTTNLCSGIS